MSSGNDKRLILMGVMLVVAVLVLVSLSLLNRSQNTEDEGRDQTPISQEQATEDEAESQASDMSDYTIDPFVDYEDYVNSGGEYPYGQYYSSFKLDTTVLTTDVYHFAGDYIEVVFWEPYCTGGEGVSDEFFVELHRVEADGSDVLVETQTLKRQEFTVGYFTDTPEGDYYFLFRKDPDDQVINCDSIEMRGFKIWV